MDTALAGYLLNPSASGYDVERLCAEYGVALADFEEPELNFGAAMPGLCQALEQAIAENNQQELLEAIEIPLSFVLAQMEHIGFYVDRESIQAYGKELEAQVNQLPRRDHPGGGVRVQHQLPPSSWGRRCSASWGCPTGKRQRAAGPPTPTCWRSCGCSTRWWDKVLRYRTVAKLKSTYCDGLLKVIGPDGRVHSHLQPDGDPHRPHLQRRAQPAEHPRAHPPSGGSCGSSSPGRAENLLVDADYSQIELRVLAHVADDAAMKEDFLEGRDIHTRHGGPRVPNARGHGHQGHALQGQGRKLRHCLRHRGLLPVQGHRRHPQGGRRLYQGVPAQLRRRGRLYEAGGGRGQGEGLCGDPLRPAALSAGAEKRQLQPAGLWGAGGPGTCPSRGRRRTSSKSP